MGWGTIADPGRFEAPAGAATTRFSRIRNAFALAVTQTCYRNPVICGYNTIQPAGNSPKPDNSSKSKQTLYVK